MHVVRFRSPRKMRDLWLFRIRERARSVIRTGVALGFAAAAEPASAATADDNARLRERMVEAIAAMARDTGRETGRPQFSARVMDAMRRVERHRFVAPELARDAYENRPLPIGNNQTISQPYIVALSTDLLDLERKHTVLEIGTGSGYQAAVLAELVSNVYSIEIVEPLGRDAAARLAALGYRNVEVRIGDGYGGWPERAPFDRILVTAAAPYVPEPLVQQLAPGGRMVIPVGTGIFGQQLLLIEKGADGQIRRKDVLPVRFVPLTGPGVSPPRSRP
jgi:protein-L-isoaspartate(D-aspartate) O-methyltransferase